ncbi:hypothetical protein V8G54_009011 [Vigna mungo]|uniref:Uncharacterized protein n=1 Tax=Vigna mungo TaxID=3915 RepID=A0AAQ3P4Q7_VIGMU
MLQSLCYISHFLIVYHFHLRHDLHPLISSYLPSVFPCLHHLHLHFALPSLCLVHQQGLLLPPILPLQFFLHRVQQCYHPFQVRFLQYPPIRSVYHLTVVATLFFQAF